MLPGWKKDQMLPIRDNSHKTEIQDITYRSGRASEVLSGMLVRVCIAQNYEGIKTSSVWCASLNSPREIFKIVGRARGHAYRDPI